MSQQRILIGLARAEQWIHRAVLCGGLTLLCALCFAVLAYREASRLGLSLPWLTAFGMTASVLFPLSLYLLHRSFRLSQDTSETAFQHLKRAEWQFRQMAENIDAVFWLTDLQGNKLFYVSPAYERLWGRAYETLHNDPRAYLEAVHPEDRPALEAALRKSPARLVRGESFDEEYRIIQPDGSVRWIRQRIFPVREQDLVVQRLAGLLEDVSERRTAQEKLRQRIELQQLVSAISASFLSSRTDEIGSTIVDTLSTVASYLGANWGGVYQQSAEEESATCSRSQVWSAGSEDSQEGPPETIWAFDAPWLLGRLEDGDIVHFADVRGLPAEAEPELRRLPVLGQGSLLAVPLISRGQTRGFLAVGGRRRSALWEQESVTFLKIVARVIISALERQRVEELRHLALSDTLTRLPNRAYLLQRLERSLERSRHVATYGFTLLFIDLDGFKQINDRFGHASGDQLLLRVAERLQGSLRPRDAVARLGGDEFVLILEDVQDLGVAREVAERLLTALALPIHCEARRLTVTASVGIALSSPNLSPEQLLAQADRAMYLAKKRGKSTFCSAPPDPRSLLQTEGSKASRDLSLLSFPTASGA